MAKRKIVRKSKKVVKKSKKVAKKRKTVKKATKKVVKKSGKKTAKKVVKKRRKASAPYTAKFDASPLTDRQKKVFEFLKKKGPSSLQAIGDAVFSREQPKSKSKRNSWTRNQLRNLRAHKLVKHRARNGKTPALYEVRA